MKSYQQFAYLYDFLMREAPYEQWLDIWKLLEQRGIICPQEDLSETQQLSRMTPSRGMAKYKIADIGCGTGTLSLMLAERGHKVWGIDVSEDMLATAESKRAECALPLQHNMRFLCQDMRELHLPETVDVVLSFCDSMNYLESVEDLRVTFDKLHRVLKHSGIFAFDMLSLQKMRHLIGDQRHFEVSDDVVSIWQNDWDEAEHLLHYDVSFFVREAGDLYRRFDEYHLQKGFTIDEVRRVMIDSGFEIIREFSDFDWDKPIGDAEDRYFWVARKTEKS